MRVFPTPVGVFPALPCPAPVFPTPVGVFPSRACALSQSACLPHARGGVSMSDALDYLGKVSSPRPWGCFRVYCPQTVPGTVFPTPVGVFLEALCQLFLALD